ncbi:MAG: hypothetical protein QXF17_05265 [Ignisphaera sp.]
MNSSSSSGASSSNNNNDPDDDYNGDDDKATSTTTAPITTAPITDTNIKQDIEMIINELVKPILPHIILYVLKRKAPYLDLLSPFLDLNKEIEDGINDGLRHARSILYNEKREKLTKIIDYLIKKYGARGVISY